MNYILSNAHNIDSLIQELQTKLYNHLVNKWSTTKLDAYGRVYKNEQDGKVIPQVYDSLTKNYKRVFYNNQSCFFFVDDDNHPLDDEDHEFTTSIKIVFMLNLDDVKTETERADADVKRDVIVFLTDNDHHFSVTGYEKGIENVFRGFDTSSLQKPDLQPMHVFSVETNWSYTVI